MERTPARAVGKSRRGTFNNVPAHSNVAGVASIVDLLDAQNQLLSAKLAVANAFYGFLTDQIAAEEAMAFYPFLEPEPEVT